MTLVFWQSVPSAHLIYFMSSIHRVNNHYKVILVVNNLSDGFRESMGWNFYDKYENVDILVAPSQNQVKDILALTQTIHIISGFKGFPFYELVLHSLKSGLISGGFLMERPILWGIRGWVRRMFAFWFEGRYARNAKFVFTFGEEAVNWYRSSGFTHDKVIPFLYTVSTSQDSNPVHPVFQKNENWFDIVFVGSVIERKGVDILIKALSQLEESYKYRLHIIGDGDQKKIILELVKDLNLSEKVFFYGYQPNEVSRATIAESDLLVLPSRFDGWGAVVNESLTQGIPVICTTSCGAASLLLNKPNNGTIVNANDVNSLSIALTMKIKNWKITDEDRLAIIKWAKQSISPLVAAGYFLKQLEDLSNDEGINGGNSTPWEK